METIGSVGLTMRVGVKAATGFACAATCAAMLMAMVHQ